MASCQVTPATLLDFKEAFIAPAAEAPGLPAGFPLFVESAMAWTADDFKDMKEYMYTLTSEDLAEIDNALTSFKGTFILSGLPPCALAAFLLYFASKLTRP